MKEFIKKHKWLLGLFIPVLILLGVITYLYCTNRLGYLLSFKWSSFKGSLTKLEAWLLSGSLISAFISGVFTNMFSSFLYNILFPSKEKQILKNTETIIDGQDSILETVTESNKKLDQLIKNSNIDPRDIEQYLKNLPIKNGKGETSARIDEWYQARKISIEIKELLLVVTKVVFEQNEDLTNTITLLKSTGKTDFARVLENIQKHFQEGDAEKIKLEYFSRKEKIEKENILILKQSIKATKALFAFQQTLDLYKELIVVEPILVNYFNTAYFLQKLNCFDEAAKLYQKTLTIYREHAQENPRTYLPALALTLNNFAVLHSDKNEFSQAQEKYEEALKIYRNLAQENPKMYLSDAAKTLNNLAVLHSVKNEFPQAQEKYEEALKIYRDLTQENPRTYLPDVVMTLINLANLQKIKNEFPQAQEKYEMALTIYRELAQENSGTYLPDVARTLNNLAVLHWDKNEFSPAKEEFEEALKIQRELAQENPKTYLPDVAMTLNNLAILQKDKNEFPQAQEKYEEALKIYRDLAQENPKTYLPDMAMTLNNLAILYSEKNEFPQAKEKYEEALKIYRDLYQENPQVYKIDYARTLITGVYLFKKDKNYLKIAKGILERYQEVYKAQELLERISDLE
ncbi:MAG: tetratricopeptide repeat protein [Bacteroidales bacterium]|nr:tetratricopeptide repeat protein [Bacteroidales bacterium]